MNVTKALLLVTLKSQFNLSVLKHRYFVKREKLWEPAVALLILLGFIPFEMLVVSVSTQLYTGLAAVGQQSSLLTLLFVFTQVLAFVFGLLYVIANLYFSKDIEGLLHLPVTPVQVLTARIASVWISLVLTTLPFIAPGLIVYGLLEGEGIVFYVAALLMLLLAPLLPLALATVASMLLMRVTNLKKHRDALRVLGGLLGVVFFFAFQYVGRTFFGEGTTNLEDPGAVRDLFAGPNGLAALVGSTFPPSLWATYCLTTPLFSGGWAWWGLFLGTSSLAVVLAVGSGKYFLYPGLIGSSESTSQRKKLQPNDISARISHVRSPLITLFLKEWKVFIRTPVFLLNSLMSVLFLPVMVVTPMVATNGINVLSRLAAEVPHGWEVILWGGVGVVTLICGVNSIAPSAISREGKLFYLNKTFPVPAATQVTAKWLHATLFTSIAAFIVTVGIVILGAPLSVGAWVLLLGATIAAVFNLLALMIDLRFPRLTWSNPQEAMNKNMNALINMLIEFALVLVLGSLIVIAFIVGVPPLATKLVLLLLFVACNWGLLKGVQAYAERRYEQIEV